MLYKNVLIVRGLLNEDPIEKQVDYVVQRLKRTYGVHCVQIDLHEVELFGTNVYKRYEVQSGAYIKIREMNIQAEATGPAFQPLWAAMIAVWVDDPDLHEQLKVVQHGDANAFTAQS